MSENVTNSANALDLSNSIFQKAVSFVRDTNQNLFLTGKAGTGKTTFLKYIKTQTRKQCAIIAPTGVAAINAGGETIHAFLQLPFSPFVPGSAGGFGKLPGADDKHSLLANLRLRDTKIKIIRKLELLIIDEVSMVRCDLLDAMDLVLRHVRRNMLQPFGGIQVVFIGDLFQLPPVAPENDWSILRQYYQSPYFFDSYVLRQTPPLYIELTKIYRQKDQIFIDILNRVRSGNTRQSDIDQLNKQYDPLPKKEPGYIILSTHNRIADEINQKALEDLPGTLHKFKGSIKNEFNPKNLPTDEELLLKTGAQVMFIKNDLKVPKRYYNGKIGVVSAISAGVIYVKFPGENDNDALQLEQETWKNMRYTLNQQKGEIEEEESGSFTQYPVRLAWAVTVHKSQGLTLQKAVVDLNQSFAPGQVYVALSRCVNMEGLSLRTMLHLNNVIVDERVINFAQNESDEDELEELLETSMRQTAAEQLCKLYSLTELTALAERTRPELIKKKSGPVEENLKVIDAVIELLNDAKPHADNFQRLIMSLSAARSSEKLEERKKAATAYFTDKVVAPCRTQIAAHLLLLETYGKIIKLTKLWKDLDAALIEKANELQKALSQ